MKADVAKYSFHGIGIAVSGAESVRTAIHSRLESFSAEELENDHIRFEYRSVSASDEHVVARPSGKGRSVDEPGAVETLYFESQDQLYIDYSDRIRLLCDPNRSHVLLSVRERGERNDWLTSHPAFTVPLAELLKRRGLFGLHTAALSIDGKAVLFAGDSGAGKSTLMITLLRKGFGYLADDMVFLTKGPQGLRVLGFPDEIDLTDGTIALFTELGHLSSLPKSDGWHKRQIRPEQLYPGNMVSECKPGLLIFPRISGNASSVLKPMSSGEALLQLLSNIIRTDSASSQNHLDALTALVKESKCYRLETGRDFDALPELFRGIAGSA